MKLSEAIRIGAKKRPQQCFGSYFKYDVVGNRTASCALGAAVEGLETEHGSEAYISLFRMTPDADLRDLVTGWNDFDKLTREEIADRLEARGL